MQYLIRFLATLPGLLMLVNALQIIVSPEAMLKGLGLPMLTGVALSSQVGDTGAFFMASAVFAIYGGVRASAGGLVAAALMLGLAAFYRLIAWQLHGAEFTGLFIGVEIVSTIWLLGFAAYFKKQATN